MGCDIHFYAEKKRGDGIWLSADRWTPDPDSENRDRLVVDYGDRFYRGRNYNIFSILADVRNGRGFAGVDTGDGFVPISKPRGLPVNVSPSVKASSDEWGRDGHSHSWLTVRELLEYDWTRTTNLRGVVGAAEFWCWDRYDRSQGESPEDFCGAVSGGTVRVVSEREMRAMLEPYLLYTSVAERTARIAADLKDVYCRCEWQQPYYKAAGSFLSETMPRLWRLGKPDDVRCVFWFDN